MKKADSTTKECNFGGGKVTLLGGRKLNTGQEVA